MVRFVSVSGFSNANGEKQLKQESHGGRPVMGVAKSVNYLPDRTIGTMSSRIEVEDSYLASRSGIFEPPRLNRG